MNVTKWIKLSRLFFVLLLSTQFSFASTSINPPVHEASFQRIFDGTNYFGEGLHFSVILSTMSNDGKIVAFYGGQYFDGDEHRKLFIHAVDSTQAAVEVILPPRVSYFNQNAGLTSNEDGSRIFFLARDADNAGAFLFCMLNGQTGAVSILMGSDDSNIEVPVAIATDAAGDYLYFNERDSGYRNEGDLWRIQAVGGAVPELVIQAAGIAHPSGGFGRYIGQFDVSDDGKTIAFFVRGWQKADDTSNRFDRELFVRTDAGIKNLTNNDQNNKGDLRLSGDGSTIVYTGSHINETTKRSYDWMVTSPISALNGQRHIEGGYGSCGDRPGISNDGSVIFGQSTKNGISSCNGYLIQTDGSKRLQVGTYSSKLGINVRGTSEGLHLSNDGKRVFFKQLGSYGGFGTSVSYLYTGAFNSKPWPTQVPSISNVSYPYPLYANLEDKKQKFDINIAVNDNLTSTLDGVGVTRLYPDGYMNRSSDVPIVVYQSSIEEVPGVGYVAEGRTGSSWPATDPVTMRFAVQDADGNVGYSDTVIYVTQSESVSYCARIDSDLYLTLPCVKVNDVSLYVGLKRVPHPEQADGLLWLLNTVEVNPVSLTPNQCTTIHNQLDLMLNCIRVGDNNYKVLLNFYTNKKSPDQLFWEFGGMAE